MKLFRKNGLWPQFGLVVVLIVLLSGIVITISVRSDQNEIRDNVSVINKLQTFQTYCLELSKYDKADLNEDSLILWKARASIKLDEIEEYIEKEGIDEPVFLSALKKLSKKIVVTNARDLNVKTVVGFQEQAGSLVQNRREVLADISAALNKKWLLLDFMLIALFFVVLAYVIQLRSFQREIRDHQQTQLKLKSANKARTDFINNISEELISPINSIIGHSEVLNDSYFKLEDRKHISALQKAAIKLKDEFSQVLAFSERGMQIDKPEEEAVDIYRFVDDLYPQIRSRIKNSDMQMQYCVSPMLPDYILADPRLIKQAIIILLDNAIKFSERGVIELKAELDSSGEKNISQIKFSVSDEGKGVRPEDMARIFDPFENGKKSLLPNGGTGIGLALFKRIVHKMNGHISTESIPGEGSTFSFCIPLKPVEDLHSPIFRPYKALHGYSLFIVGDQPYYEKLLKSTKNRWGLAVLDLAPNELQGLLLKRKQLILFDQDWIARNYEVYDEFFKLNQRKSTQIMIVGTLDENEMQVSGDAGLMPHYIRENPSHTEFYDELIMASKEQGKGGNEILTPKSIEILAVEDDPSNQRLFAAMLKKLGYYPIIADSGEEGLNMMKLKRFDIIFMDLQLPGMDGVRTSIKIRKNNPQLPPAIIALTANDNQDNKQTCFEAGMNDFLTKPFTLHKLKETIEFWGEKITQEAKSSSN